RFPHQWIWRHAAAATRDPARAAPDRGRSRRTSGIRRLARRQADLERFPALATSGLERFQAKACPALDAGWMQVRVKTTRQNKIEIVLPFRFNRNGKGSRS